MTMTNIEGPKVVLLDDEASVLRSLARVVARAGYSVTTTSSVREAVERCMRGDADAIVADLHMPEMLGTFALALVARGAPQVGRVLMTGEADLRRVVETLAPNTVQAVVAKVDAVRKLPEVLREVVRSQSDGSDINEQQARNLADGIVRALALRDYETETHCHRVAALSRRLGEQLGIAGRTLLDVELGALLHDMGKIGVRDAILLKPGKLTEEEWIEMRRHPDLGAQLLADMPLLVGAIDVVQNHHERWVGGGYPRNLVGEQIPIAARIFQIADTYDAIVSDRPYRKGQPPEAARAEIQKHVGTQFDPAVVEAYLSVDAGEWDQLWLDVGQRASKTGRHMQLTPQLLAASGV